MTFSGRQKCGLVLLSVFLFVCFPLSGADKEKNSRWVLSACAFEGDENFSSVLPSLILAAIPENLTRKVTEAEQVFLRSASHASELSSLQKTMQKDIADRDGVLFKNISDYEKQKQIADYEKKIRETQEKIRAILESSDESEGQSSEELIKTVTVNDPDVLYAGEIADAGKNCDGLISGTVFRRDKYMFVSATLYTFPGFVECGTVETAGFASEFNELAEEIASQFVSLLSDGDSVEVAVTVEQPGAIVRIDNTVCAANALRAAEFHTSSGLGLPKSAAAWQNPTFVTASVQKGIHNVLVECAGYRTLSFEYDFSDSAVFSVAVSLEPVKTIELHLVAEEYAEEPAWWQKTLDWFDKPEEYAGIAWDFVKDKAGYVAGLITGAKDEDKTAGIPAGSETSEANEKARKTESAGSDAELSPGLFYVQALLAGGMLSGSKAYASVNSLPVLGQYAAPNGRSSFFVINEPADSGSKNLSALEATLVTKETDTDSLIEKRRKSLYNAYGFLLGSLPLAFFTYGRMVDYANVYRRGGLSSADAQDVFAKYQGWRIGTFVTMGVSVCAGVNFVAQIARYLLAADEVLPETATSAQK